MKLAIFVHDLTPGIGHSRALIEVINELPSEEIESLQIVSFTCDQIVDIFPKLAKKTTFHKVPFENLYPFLFKMLFYHVWTFFHSALFLKKDVVKIGIGIASLTVDIVNVQFVHHQWHKFYFKLSHLSFLAKIYKKILFLFFNLGEKYLYTRPRIKLIALSKFVGVFCKSYFKMQENQVQIAYSGINLSEFAGPIDSQKAYDQIAKIHPEIVGIDLSKPIFLFVGAYERKGINYVLKALRQWPESQLVVLGSPESKSLFEFPEDLKIFKIKHSKEISLFYSLADTFLFPSIYEPFGLVIIEAAAMGLELYITKENVGATEILENLDGIHVFDSPQSFAIKSPIKVSQNQKVIFRNERLKTLEIFSWKKTSQVYYQTIKELILSRNL